MKIYFSGAIRGNRDQLLVFQLIIKELQRLGHSVLTEHVGHSDVLNEEKEYTNEFIFQRDFDWLSESDIIVAEVSGHSTGVGMEIGFALDMEKKVFALYRAELENNVSKMVLGCEDIIKIPYFDEIDLIKKIDENLRF